MARVLLAPGTAAVGIAASRADGDQTGSQDRALSLPLRVVDRLRRSADQCTRPALPTAANRPGRCEIQLCHEAGSLGISKHALSWLVETCPGSLLVQEHELLTARSADQRHGSPGEHAQQFIVRNEAHGSASHGGRLSLGDVRGRRLDRRRGVRDASRVGRRRTRQEQRESERSGHASQRGHTPHLALMLAAPGGCQHSFERGPAELLRFLSGRLK